MITTRRRPLLSSRRFVLSSSQHQLETRHLWHTTASHYTETISVLCYTCPACYTCHTDILSSHEVPGPISNDTQSWWGVYRSLCQHREKCANNIQLQRSLYWPLELYVFSAHFPPLSGDVLSPVYGPIIPRQCRIYCHHGSAVNYCPPGQRAA